MRRRFDVRHSHSTGNDNDDIFACFFHMTLCVRMWMQSDKMQ